MDAMIPVTLLSGFLGAGKTTVLNALLEQESGLRFAIVENEFGAVNIDSQLLSQRRAGVLELSNGCVCCSVNGDLVRGLQDMAAQHASGALQFDRIIIESTGLADPGAVAQTFFAAPELRDTFMLDGIVVVVDALHARQQLDEHAVARRQVGFADRLLLSKCDLVDAASLVELSARLQRMNPRALQQTLEAGRAAPGSLLNIGGFMLDESLLARPFQFGTGTRFSPVAAASPTLQASAPVHDDDIASFVLEGDEVDLARIGNFVQALIDEFGTDLLRYKGILAVAGDERKLIFQGVQRTAGFDHGEAWAPDATRASAIVLIGKGLPQQRLRQAFLATLATSQA